MKLNEKRIVNDIRLLSLDMIKEARSGYPGIVLSMAPTLYTLFAYHLKFDLERKNWCNRDRLVMSSSYATPLLYSTLFYLLEEFDYDDLRNFKKVSSSLTGDLLYNIDKRIELTPGTFGMGFATSVGMAIGEKYLEATFNRKKNTVFDYNVYAICTDEDMMEGISYEAASLAGTLNLNNLIVLYISTSVTADGETEKTFDEDVSSTYAGMGFEVINVKNGDSVGDISSAIDKAKKSKKPALVKINIPLGKYSQFEGTNKIYATLSDEDLSNIRTNLKGGYEFSYSKEDREAALKFIKEGTDYYYRDWYSEYEMYIANATDSERDAINLVIDGEGIALDIDAVVDSSKIFEDKTMRDINYQIMNVISTFVPNFVGGSADCFGYSKNFLKGKEQFSSSNYGGRNIYFGLRENVMGAIMNGLALTNIRSYGSTLLTNACNMLPAIKMSSMMALPVTYIFTHDSIRNGEMGATYEPIFELGLLRSILGFSVYRPCDYKELIGSWSNILKEGKPCALVLPRGHNETIKYSSPKKVERGAYIVSEVKTRLDLIIIATGSEVNLALQIKEELLKNYIEARVVSMPNMELFLKQDKEYQKQVFPIGYRKMVIELSNDGHFFRFITSEDDFISVNKYGVTGSEEDVMSYFELDISNLVIKIKNSL